MSQCYHRHMTPWAKFVQLAAVFFIAVAFFPTRTSAQISEGANTHHTVIISQVRGNECCSAGNAENVLLQLDAARKANVPLTLTVRYDALSDRQIVSLLHRAGAQGHELGAFLEITPKFASDAGVAYPGDPETWYHAEQAYFVGYPPDDRRKLIDTYMKRFFSVFGRYPTTTTAWIIDTASLRYLREKYGVLVHEITREQWGTDSYTLWGGPPHQPYWPTDSWVFQPSASVSATLPLIVRQTVADPVWNYGDTSNSHTSQPNDYSLENRGFDYFRHLFSQAHGQSQPTTFALLGLENSMSQKDQEEFGRQVAFVGRWQEEAPRRQVLKAKELAAWYQQPENYHPFWLDAGRDQSAPSQQAWYVTTPTYRARLRQDGQDLFLSDLRLYSPEFTDPYTDATASRSAFWVVPFVLDGGRFWQDDTYFHSPANDQLSQRKKGTSSPTALLIANNLTQPLSTTSVAGKIEFGSVASFDQDGFSLRPDAKILSSPLLDGVIDGLFWTSGREKLWGFSSTNEGQYIRYVPEILQPSLQQERAERYPFLFPEIRSRPISAEKSQLLLTNSFALASRNPIRLAFFPKDEYGFPALIEDDPSITTDGREVNITITRPDGGSGLLFADLKSQHPQKITITLQWHGVELSTDAVFAPNCKRLFRECLITPKYFWWYLRNWVGDQYRSLQNRLSDTI